MNDSLSQFKFFRRDYIHKEKVPPRKFYQYTQNSLCDQSLRADSTKRLNLKFYSNEKIPCIHKTQISRRINT